jgi:hypothetical protein
MDCVIMLMVLGIPKLLVSTLYLLFLLEILKSKVYLSMFYVGIIEHHRLGNL